MSRFVDNGMASDKVDLRVLLVIYMLHLSDTLKSRRGGCGGRFDDHGLMRS